jgi:hypothetical protein
MMNTLASNILQSLGAQGVQSLRFRILKLAGGLRHTTPVADTDTGRRSSQRLPSFSISDLFNAYSLVPRTGEYVLNVAEGLLAFLPATARRLAKPVETRAKALKFTHAKAKITRRHARHLHAGARIAA